MDDKHSHLTTTRNAGRIEVVGVSGRRNAFKDEPERKKLTNGRQTNVRILMVQFHHTCTRG